eukprot:TRINITY_DN27490_c0_g1_i1.p1 TRINITY_DN27490_c0_g1~~TRINITY_DN27490_c0_g1_i1.p1  ORF type:complete len:659 (-),score=116.11 TRINITY_DN27490_c0_g1_i1:351-2327(-)
MTEQWELKQAVQLRHQSHPQSDLFFSSKLGSFVDVPVYARADLDEGSRIVGPAIIAEAYTTTVVTDSFDCRVLPNGFLQLEIKPDKSAASLQELPVFEAESPDDVLCTSERILLQLCWKNLLSAIEEQMQLLVRSAFSPLARESGAIACGVYDLKGRLLVQGSNSSPGLMVSMSSFVQRVLSSPGLAAIMETGDSVAGNGAWAESGRSSDLVAITPCLVEGHVAGFISSTVHTVNFKQGSDSDAIMPASLITKQGNVCDDALHKMASMFDRPSTVTGDAMALLAANEFGQKRLSLLLSERGVQFMTLADHICGASRCAILSCIAQKLGEGSWTNEVSAGVLKGATGKGEQLRLAATLTSFEDGSVDLLLGRASLSKQAGGDSRSPLPSSCVFAAYSRFALISIFGRSIPLNQGVLSAFSVSADGALGQGHRATALAHLVPDLVLGCIAKVLPDEVPAESASLLGRLDIHEHGTASRPKVVAASHVEGGGLGGCAHRDGFNATLFPTSLRSVPVEITEATSSIVFKRKEFIQDSGGAGCFRGGLGLRFEVANAGTADLSFRVRQSHVGISPKAQGRNGGQAGRPPSVHHGDKRAPDAKEFQHLLKGRSVVIETGGGGGYGSPTKRPRTAVLEDVRDGLVSHDAAVRQYGFSKAELKKQL